MFYNFIKNNFSNETLTAYNLLIPTAYKADLWRYCVLYTYGGVYSDYSQEILRPFDININNIDMLLVKDRNNCNSYNIQISFMATKPKNNFFKFIINNLTIDILNKRKGICPIDVTGPTYFGRLFCKYFSIDKIHVGMHNLSGLDNNMYKIYIPFYMYSSEYINDLNNKLFIKILIIMIIYGKIIKYL